VGNVVTYHDTGQVVIQSLWRNDTRLDLEARMHHLIEKTYRPRRFVWVVGDCYDDTEERLRAFAQAHCDRESITVLRHDTGSMTRNGSVENDERLRVLSATADAGIDSIVESGHADEYVLFHESDLVSPPDLVERLLETGCCPVGGVVWLTLPDGGPRLFFDTWGYRAENTRFRNSEPHHALWHREKGNDVPIEVETIGSVVLHRADDLRQGARMETGGHVRLCEIVRERFGRKVFFDPRIAIEQPHHLWCVHDWQ